MMKIKKLEKFLTDLSDDILFLFFISVMYNIFLFLLSFANLQLNDYLLDSLLILWFICLVTAFTRVSRRRMTYGFKHLILINTIITLLFFALSALFVTLSKPDIYQMGEDFLYLMASASIGYLIAKKVDFQKLKEKLSRIFDCHVPLDFFHRTVLLTGKRQRI